MTSVRPPVYALVLVALIGGSAALAQVDCGNPANLCSGDPCVIPSVDVASPCDVDFRPRTVIVAGTLRVPPNGELSLTAGAITVSGVVRNAPNLGTGSGPSITLTATDDVHVTGRISLGGKLVPGSVTVNAGGAVGVAGKIATSTRPTSVTVTAGGNVDVPGSILAASGAGSASITAGGAMSLDGRMRNFTSLAVHAGGDVGIGGSLTSQTKAGTVTIESGGMLTFDGLVRLPLFDVALRGATGARVQRRIAVNAVFDPSGSVEVSSSAGGVTIDDVVSAGAVELAAAGDVAVHALVSASQPARSGGPITISSSAGSVTLGAALKATGGDGNLATDGAGGDVEVTAADTVVVSDDVSVNSSPLANAPGGSIRLTGATVQVGPGVTLDARGCRNPTPCDFFRPPAVLHFDATGGSLALDGTFVATGGATVIEGSAAADLHAAGSFTAAPAGCIALSAGGTLDTAAATFDPPFGATCP